MPSSMIQPLMEHPGCAKQRAGRICGVISMTNLADPSLEPDLALLFDGRRAPVPGPDAGPGALDRYLEGVQAEAEVIAELLNDG